MTHKLSYPWACVVSLFLLRPRRLRPAWEAAPPHRRACVLGAAQGRPSRRPPSGLASPSSLLQTVSDTPWFLSVPCSQVPQHTPPKKVLCSLCFSRRAWWACPGTLSAASRSPSSSLDLWRGAGRASRALMRLCPLLTRAPLPSAHSTPALVFWGVERSQH